MADARLGRARRTLTVQFYGAPSGTGPCSASYTLDRAFSSTAVAVAVRKHKRDGTALCTAVGYPRRVTMVLPALLGGRVLVDGASGVAVTVLPAGP